MDRRILEALWLIQTQHCTLQHQGQMRVHEECRECAALIRLLRWVQAPATAPEPVQGERACGA